MRLDFCITSPFLNSPETIKFPPLYLQKVGAFHIEQEVCCIIETRRVADFCFLCLSVVLWQGIGAKPSSPRCLQLFEFTPVCRRVIYWKRRADMKVLSGTGAKLIMTNYAGVRNWSCHSDEYRRYTDWNANFTVSPLITWNTSWLALAGSQATIKCMHERFKLYFMSVFWTNSNFCFYFNDIASNYSTCHNQNILLKHIVTYSLFVGVRISQGEVVFLD